MDLKHLEEDLKGIRHLLSHLHSEVTVLEGRYSQVLRVLRTLEEVAHLDELTGLFRRGRFFKGFESMLHECQEQGQNCGVLLVDIDFFKRVNDTHGHPTGDEVLRKVGQLLKCFDSPRCFSGRYGGEEFVVAVRGSDAEILGVAEMIRRSAEHLHGPVVGPDDKPLANVMWKCTLSVGVASSHDEEYDADSLLRAADRALYEAKRRGRNQVRVAA